MGNERVRKWRNCQALNIVTQMNFLLSLRIWGKDFNELPNGFYIGLRKAKPRVNWLGVFYRYPFLCGMSLSKFFNPIELRFGCSKFDFCLLGFSFHVVQLLK